MTWGASFPHEAGVEHPAIPGGVTSRKSLAEVGPQQLQGYEFHSLQAFGMLDAAVIIRSMRFVVSVSPDATHSVRTTI